MAPVILYDIPSKSGECWSLNPWKPRMVLNYKKIDYKTEWIEYPDIAPTLKSFGLLPTPKDDPGYFVDYTSPALRFTDGTVIMDSYKIAQELENRYPTPSLHLDNPVITQVREILGKIFVPLRNEILPKIPRNVLNSVSAEYFESTRKEMFGMSLAEVEKQLGGEKAWEEAKEPVKEMAELLKRNGGPFFLGEEVCYADVVVVTFLEFLGRAERQLLERFLAMDPAFGKLYDASKEWVKKAD